SVRLLSWGIAQGESLAQMLFPWESNVWIFVSFIQFILILRTYVPVPVFIYPYLDDALQTQDDFSDDGRTEKGACKDEQADDHRPPTHLGEIGPGPADGNPGIGQYRCSDGQQLYVLSHGNDVAAPRQFWNRSNDAYCDDVDHTWNIQRNELFKYKPR